EFQRRAHMILRLPTSGKSASQWKSSLRFNVDPFHRWESPLDFRLNGAGRLRDICRGRSWTEAHIQGQKNIRRSDIDLMNAVRLLGINPRVNGYGSVLAKA